ncbi:MAG: non-heme iron oxygenase ferredoxin subunit [Armatimonadota bacterium]|nr:non-heme iron oxygenase ferredoxin subunit [Armatimonadota bacterium]MDR7460506.1 non-heme iron oxygenase ferredoxin subunit [Armatimonadota bacterium]MDR7479616.1 non-heme iron oxygenase ferredoxin subunit [Armatimonadota bacterium]MDR7489726.1 non-heme iron oxygenase ferredoxin subunit [Armatimonadota bacterium]MDR7490785.1 non-heme iron oxygenase ferredoxin subunit [Armatimonadota bacterium]
MASVPVARTSDLQPGEGRVVEAAGQAVALFRTAEGWYAIDNTCPHRGCPLGDGALEGFTVTCPCHGSQFDIRTGAVLMPPALTGVRAYPVQVQGDEVRVVVD